MNLNELCKIEIKFEELISKTCTQLDSCKITKAAKDMITIVCLPSKKTYLKPYFQPQNKMLL